MTGKTHQVLGVAVGLGTYLAASDTSYQPATLAWVLVVSSLAALLPDIDTATGAIWHQIPFGHLFGRAVDPFLTHRNITHSLLGFGLICWGVSTLLSHAPSYWGVDIWLVLISFSAAYLSHLVADMITVEGIPLFFPVGKMIGFPPKPFDGLRIVTGKWFENWLIFPAVNVGLIILVISNWEKIKDLILKP